MGYVELDERLLEDIKKLTITNYKEKGNFVPIENIEPMLEDLMCEINSLKEKLEDETEQRREYYKPKSEYELVGMKESDF